MAHFRSVIQLFVRGTAPKPKLSIFRALKLINTCFKE